MFKASLHGKDSFSEESGRVGEIIAPEQQDIACVAIAAGRQRRLSIPHGAVFHNLAGM